MAFPRSAPWYPTEVPLQGRVPGLRLQAGAELARACHSQAAVRGSLKARPVPRLVRGTVRLLEASCSTPAPPSVGDY